MKLRLTLVAVAAFALLLTPAAVAHVEISPKQVALGSFARFTIEVPAERKVPTVKLEVKLPPGLRVVRLATKPGWKSTNLRGVVTWSGGKIQPGKAGKFAFRARVAGTPGNDLVFPALQTYADGTIVRWIGAPDSDTPAPRVVLGTGKIEPVGPIKQTDHGTHRRNIAWGVGIGLVAGLLGFVLFRKRRA